MRSIRRVGGVAIAGLLLSAMVAGSASADTPANYAGSASGYALKLAGLGQSLTAGSSDSKAASDGTGKATGTGASVVASTAVTATNPPGETKPETCGTPAVPAPLNAVLLAGLACGSASATGSGLTSTATSTGKVAGVDLNVQTVLGSVPTGTVITPVSGALASICAALPAQLAQLSAVTSTVQELLQSVTSTQTLSAEIGSSTSSVKVTGTSVTSDSTSQAAIIKILPLPTLNGVALGEPFATITISRANAKTVCDLSNGNAVPSFDPAIVRVKVAGPLVPLLSTVNLPDPLPLVSIPGNPLINGQLDPVLNFQNGEFTVTPGSTVVLFPGLPIETEITVGAGTAKVNADRTASASAEGVKIHAVRKVGAPIADGLLLNLAHAEAAGGCVAATVTPPTPATPTAAPEIPRELPRTGGTPWLPLGGAAFLALAVLTRRTLVRTR